MRRFSLMALLVGGILIFGLLPTIPDPAAAESTDSPIDIRYSIHIGGIKVGEIGLVGSISQQGYSAKADGAGKGLLSLLRLFTTIDIAADARGALDKDGKSLLPSQFNLDIQIADEDTDLTIQYDKEQIPSVSVTPAFREVYPITDAQLKGALDPISATVALNMPQKRESVCNRSIKLFDGRRLFRIVITNIRGKRYDGAIVCNVRFENVAGIKPSVIARQPYVPMTAIFAENSDNRWQLIQVYGEIENWGTAVANLLP